MLSLFLDVSDSISVRKYHREVGCDMCKAVKELYDADYSCGMEQGMEQGIEKGIEKGIEQGIE